MPCPCAHYCATYSSVGLWDCGIRLWGQIEYQPSWQCNLTCLDLVLFRLPSSVFCLLYDIFVALRPVPILMPIPSLCNVHSQHHRFPLPLLFFRSWSCGDHVKMSRSGKHPPSSRFIACAYPRKYPKESKCLVTCMWEPIAAHQAIDNAKHSHTMCLCEYYIDYSRIYVNPRIRIAQRYYTERGYFNDNLLTLPWFMERSRSLDPQLDPVQGFRGRRASLGTTCSYTRCGGDQCHARH